MAISVIGDRGLVINDANDVFSYVKESEWRKLPRYALPTSGPIATLTRLAAVFGKIGESVYVDLDKLAHLPETEGSAEAQALGSMGLTAVPEVSGTNLVLKEFDTLRVVPASSWTESDVTIAGDAMVAIDRGVPLASIPVGNIPSGTFCVLINIKAMV